MSYTFAEHLGEGTDELYGYIATMYCNYLECNIEDIILHPDADPETAEDGELWETEDFVNLVKMDDVEVPGLSLGYIAFGTYKGVKAVFEQNAAPIGIWIKREA